MAFSNVARVAFRRSCPEQLLKLREIEGIACSGNHRMRRSRENLAGRMPARGREAGENAAAPPAQQRRRRDLRVMSILRDWDAKGAHATPLRNSYLLRRSLLDIGSAMELRQF
eukprot:1472954-Rhodomonas_salina.2